MADSRAFTYKINPIGSGDNENNSIHQVSPAWVLTFVRWENRDTERVTNVSSTTVRDPLVVENDCISVSTTNNKGTLTPSVSATLVMTDVNYETAVAPGDFMLVNMLNWPSDARRVANQARAKQPINGLQDGFKGIFKVQGVRKILTTDPTTGTRIMAFRINGYAFTEFNNMIYFNPYMIDPNQDPKNQLLFASYIGKDWGALVNDKGFTNVQDIIAVLIQSFIGTGVNDEGRLDKNGVVKTPNVHFYMPSLVGSLLGIDGVKAAKDIYNYIFGLQKYGAGAAATIDVGMNPLGLNEKYDRFYYTPTPCDGSSLLKPEYWNQVKAWAILNQYTNAPLNELYTCFRVSPDGDVMPTLVFRQIPFTNEDYTGPGSVTKFMNLPRWNISPALITDLDLGRDEAARVNFVQFFGRSTLGAEGADIAQEIARINYVYDIDDVQRSGLRPYIVTTQFDDPTSQKKDYHSPIWAQILGDAMIGGHLKMNGTITCAGIVDPIAVGDNLQFDGVVYHIEQISHVCSIGVQDGKRLFRTTLNLSSGVAVSSSATGTRYAEMSYQAATSLRQNDYNHNQILPGVSESQDVVYRPVNLDEPESQNNPFPQPNTKNGTQLASNAGSMGNNNTGTGNDSNSNGSGN
jgi:hypothetical protein